MTDQNTATRRLESVYWDASALVRRRYTIDGVQRNIRLEPAFWEALDKFSRSRGYTTKAMLTMWWTSSMSARLRTRALFTPIIRHYLVAWLLDEREKHRSRLPTERPWRPR